jgi:hypothetical protein
VPSPVARRPSNRIGVSPDDPDTPRPDAHTTALLPRPGDGGYWWLPDCKNQTHTPKAGMIYLPKADMIYLVPFLKTKDVGRVVLKIPPADEGVVNGTIMKIGPAAWATTP